VSFDYKITQWEFAMFHQTNGLLLPGILRAGVIDTTPRFKITGKTQEDLERELTPIRNKKGFALYQHRVDQVFPLIWEKGERPAVWLTQENRPIGSVGGGYPGAEESYRGFFRIGIDTSQVKIYPWVEVEKYIGISRKWRQTLGDAARRQGDDTSQWYFTLTPIPKAAWTTIERWERSRWVRFEIASAA